MSTVINGRELADQMQAEIQKDVEKMTQQGTSILVASFGTFKV